jgi:hypothetical protein
MKLAQQLVSSGSESWMDGLFAKIVRFLARQDTGQSIFLHDYFAKYVDVRYNTVHLLR